jgi:hypothetical protein
LVQLLAEVLARMCKLSSISLLLLLLLLLSSLLL